MTEATLLGPEKASQGYCTGSLLKATVIFVDFGVYSNLSDYGCKTAELIGPIISHLISFYVDIETFTMA